MVEFFEKDPAESKDPINAEPLQLDCSSCGAALMKVMKKQEAPTSITIKANCCFCGDSSFSQQVSGAFYMVPSNGVQLVGAVDMGNPKNFVIDTKEAENG